MSVSAYLALWFRQTGVEVRQRGVEANRFRLQDVPMLGNYFFSALLVTDVVSNSSLLLLAGPKSFLKQIDYPVVEDRVFDLTGVVSRKKQLLPYLAHCLKKGGSRTNEAA